MNRSLSRREFLRIAGVGAGAAILAACQPEVVEKEVTRVVEKEVEKKVTEIVKETVIVEGKEKVVTRVVEKVVTSAPAPAPPMRLISHNWVGAQGIPDDDALIPTRINKEFNVEIETWWLDSATWIDQLTTRFAAGEFVDFGYLDRAVFMENGMVGHITLSEFADYCPRFFKALAEWDNGSLECFAGGTWNGVRHSYGTYTVEATYGICGGFRQDSLEKVGLEVPTTIEGVEAALKAFMDKGLHRYGTGTRGDWEVGRWASYTGAYGAHQGEWTDEGDGTLMAGWIHPAYREAMKVANRWWGMGLIHPESLSMNYNEHVAKWCLGEFGYIDQSTWTRLVPGGKHYDCIIEDGGKVAMAPPVVGPEGYHGYQAPSYARWGYQIGEHVDRDPDKKMKILELIEGTSADEELATFCKYGEVGVHSYRGDDGKLYNKPPDDLPIPWAELGQTLLTATTPQIQMDWLGPTFANVTYPMLESNVPSLPSVRNFINMEPCQEYTELAQTQSLWSLDFMSGAKSPENDWDEYVDTWLAKGGECATKQANKGYAAMDSIRKSIAAEVSVALKGM